MSKNNQQRKEQAPVLPSPETKPINTTPQVSMTNEQGQVKVVNVPQATTQPTTSPSEVVANTLTLPWVQAADQLLIPKGWRKVGTNDQGESLWADPNGSSERAERKTGAVLKGVGGSVEEIQQHHCKPLEWSYPTLEAMNIQHQRDRVEAVAQSA